MCSKQFGSLKACAGQYSKRMAGKEDALLANSSFAEQQNVGLADLKPGAVHMLQTTLLWFIRLYLYKKAIRGQMDYLRRDHGARTRRQHLPETCVIAPAADPAVVADVIADVVNQ
jgi:hypothetical protein